MKFKGIDDINDIEKYKGKSLFVARENAVELEEDEYYIGDLIGMDVYTDESEERFGVLKDVMETGQMKFTSYSQKDTERCFSRQSMSVSWK